MDIIEVKEKELFEGLVNGIKDIFPVKKPRASYDMNIGVNRVKLEIEFYFYEDIKTKKVSRYVYLKKNGIKVKSFSLSKSVELKTIKEIYKYILGDYSNITKFAFQDGEFHIDVCIPQNKIYSEGISCTNICFRFRCNNNLSVNLSNEIFAWYDYFITNYMFLIRGFRRKRVKNEYNCLKKKNIVDNMSKEELDEFYDFIDYDDDTLKNLLKNMEVTEFYELLYKVFKMRVSNFDNKLKNDLIDGMMNINDVKEMINSLEESERRDMLKTISTDNFLELHRYFTSADTKEERDNLRKVLSVKKTDNGGK